MTQNIGHHTHHFTPLHCITPLHHCTTSLHSTACAPLHVLHCITPPLHHRMYCSTASLLWTTLLHALIHCATSLHVLHGTTALHHCTSPPLHHYTTSRHLPSAQLYALLPLHYCQCITPLHALLPYGSTASLHSLALHNSTAPLLCTTPQHHCTPRHVRHCMCSTASLLWTTPLNHCTTSLHHCTASLHCMCSTASLLQYTS